MKYYAVKSGKEGPKIYTSWEECEKAVKGFPGATFKSFLTLEDAQIYLDTVEERLTEYPEGHHIMVDASSSIKQNFWEFQMVWSDTKEPIYRSTTYKNGTNNTGEVLGLATALIIRAENKWDCNIYCDSMTAISACEKGSYNMKSKNISEETRKLVMDALKRLKEIDCSKVFHYNNQLIGQEIAADFGRK